jgi:hypothetical protein
MMEGPSEQMSEEITTSQRAGMRSTKRPTARLRTTPTRRFGRRYSEVVIRDLDWTSWKLGGGLTGVRSQQ